MPIRPRVIAVAVDVPRLRVPAEATSTTGVRVLVSAYKVRKLKALEPRSMVLSAPDNRSVLIATEVRLLRAVLANEPEAW